MFNIQNKMTTIMKKYIAPIIKTINLSGEAPLLANSDIDAQILDGTTGEQGSNRRNSIWGDED